MQPVLWISSVGKIMYELGRLYYSYTVDGVNGFFISKIMSITIKRVTFFETQYLFWIL